MTHVQDVADRWRSLLASHRFEKLVQALEPLGRGGEPVDDEVIRLRAEVARFGKGPWTDLLIAARTLPAPTEALLVAAIRTCAHRGARAMARTVADDAVARHPESAALRKVQRVVEGDGPVALDPLRATVDAALRAGDYEAATEAATTWLAEATDDLGRVWAYRTLAAVVAQTGDLVQAAAHRSAAAAVAPHGDDAATDRLWAGYALWAAGRAEQARDALLHLREDTRDSTRGARRRAHAQSRDLLQDLERVEAEGPRFVADPKRDPRPVFGRSPGRAALSLIAWARPELGLDPHAASEAPDLPTVAHLRHILHGANAHHARVRIDAATLTAVLRGGGMVVLPEERPTDTGFLWVERFDEVSQLLWLVDPRRPGPRLRRIAEQADRGALFGFSGLVIWGPGEAGAAQAEAAGIESDPRLDLLDACDLDPSGRPPPRARVAYLAQQGIDVCPDLPMFHRRHGESLLLQLAAGEIGLGPAGEFERWLSATRERFPDQEWPLQLYAEALEHAERYAEAGIAWSDAGLRDPLDERNHIGQARAAARIGALGSAYSLLREAAALAPNRADIQARLAENAWQRDDSEALLLHAEVALQMNPGNLRAQHYRAAAAENAGDLDRATALLETIAARDDAPAPSRFRLVRRYASAPRWDDARRGARALCEVYPGDPAAWEMRIDLAMASGDLDEGLDAGLRALDQCDPTAIAGPLCSLATIGFAADADAVTRVADALMHTPRHAEAMVLALTRVGDLQGARALLERIADALSGDLNGSWLVARTLLRVPEFRADEPDRIREVLGELCERGGGFPYPYILLARRTLADGDPERALEILEQADSQRCPALVWDLGADLYEALGRESDAETLRGRLPEVYPEGVLGELEFLRSYDAVDWARRLAQALVEAQPDLLPGRIANEWATTLTASGRHAEALKVLLALHDRRPAAVNRGELARAARRCHDWEALAAVAEAAADDIVRHSDDGNDPWIWRGIEAGAQMVRGDPSHRETLLRTAPDHIWALIELCRIERLAQAPTADADTKRLLARAPRGPDRLRRELELARLDAEAGGTP